MAAPQQRHVCSQACARTAALPPALACASRRSPAACGLQPPASPTLTSPTTSCTAPLPPRSPAARSSRSGGISSLHGSKDLCMARRGSCVVHVKEPWVRSGLRTQAHVPIFCLANIAHQAHERRNREALI